MRVLEGWVEERGEIRDIVEYLGKFLVNKLLKCLFLVFLDNNQPAIEVVCGVYGMKASLEAEEFDEGDCLIFNLQFVVEKFVHNSTILYK